MRSKAPDEVRESAPPPLCSPPRSYLLTGREAGEHGPRPSGPKRAYLQHARQYAPRLMLALLAIVFLLLLLGITGLI